MRLNKHETSDESFCKSPKQQIHDLFFQRSNPSVFSAIQKSRDAHAFKDIHSAFLIYFVQWCDDGYPDILDKEQTHVVNSNYVFLSENRNQMDNLWDINLTFPVLPTSNIQSFQSANTMMH